MERKILHFQSLSLEPGDIVVTRNPMALGRMICACEKFWEPDRNAFASHALFMVSPTKCYDILWKTKIHDFYPAYKGEWVLIGRHRLMTPDAFHRGWMAMKPFLSELNTNPFKKFYPAWRLPLYLIPPVAVRVSTGNFMVCSEKAMRFLCESQINPKIYNHWRVMPSYIEDVMRRWSGWTTQEGILT